MKTKIKSKSLMSARLRMRMAEKGFTHRNGSAFQMKLAEAIGQPEKQGTLSGLLNKKLATIDTELLNTLAKELDCQATWLVGGENKPVQEKPLFLEQIHAPEEKQPEKAQNDALVPFLEKISDALYMIMRQLQKINEREEGKNND